MDWQNSCFKGFKWAKEFLSLFGSVLELVDETIAQYERSKQAVKEDQMREERKRTLTVSAKPKERFRYSEHSHRYLSNYWSNLRCLKCFRHMADVKFLAYITSNRCLIGVLDGCIEIKVI